MRLDTLSSLQHDDDEGEEIEYEKEQTPQLAMEALIAAADDRNASIEAQPARKRRRIAAPENIVDKAIALRRSTRSAPNENKNYKMLTASELDEIERQEGEAVRRMKEASNKVRPP